jgi:signal transduction histidine kinase/ActR/RegA family two-component response regulator
VLTTAGTLGSVLIWQNYSHSLAEMRRHAVTDAQAASRMAEPALLLNDKVAVDRVVHVAAQDPSVEGAMILDGNGRQFGVYQRQTASAPRDDFDPRAALERPITRSSIAVVQSGTQLRIVAPIWREKSGIDMGLGESEEPAEHGADSSVGFVYLTYGLQDIQHELTRRILGSAAVAALVVGLGIAATLAGVRQLLLPLHDLVRTTGEIAQGNRTIRAGEQAVGELGDLARSFNHMADHIEAAYAEIEQKVVVRTAELETRQRQLEDEITERQRIEAQLREAKEVAEAASRAKSDFLANMSHEIRTPLTAILGFTETLLDPGLTEAQRLDAGMTIRRSGEHLLQIIGDILDISCIEAGQLKVEYLACPVVRVVAEVESLMRARAIEKALPFEVEYAGPVPEMIETDPTRLRQILVNLAANAIKFTERGRVQLRISLEQPTSLGDEPGPQLRFDVIDTGIGMTANQLAHVFQPFTQADETMTRRFGGTGLGLAISQRLASKLGGAITAASEPGKGSTFTLTIPAGRLPGGRYVQPSERCLSADSLASPSTEGSVSLAGCRALLAEDGPDNQRLIVYLLEKAGAQVATVENGARAVEAAIAAREQGRPFHVVLMDMQMPVMDGYAATRRLRSLGYARPIIALTAHAMEGDSGRCLEAGCDDYAAKPIDRRALLATIARHMEQARTLIPSA